MVLPAFSEPAAWPEPSGRPHLQLVPDGGEFEPVDRHGRTVHRIPPASGGPSISRPAPARRSASARVRRRRLLVVATAVGLAVALAGPVSGLLAHATPAPALTTAAEQALPVSSAAGEGTFYVVRPGDTLESIATRIAPSNPGLVQTELAHLVGSNEVVAGEHIRFA